MTTKRLAIKEKCKTPKCYQRFIFPSVKKRHEKTCTDKQIITVKRKVFGRLQNEYYELKKMFPPGWTISQDVTTFDIETLEKKENNNICLKLLSIGVASTLGESKYFVRSSSDPKAAQKLVDEFMDYLCTLQEIKQSQIPDYVIDEINSVDNELEQGFSLKNMRKKKFLKKCTMLNIFGFNSGGFDMKMLISYLASYGKRHGWADPCVLKKLTKYLSVEIGQLHFKGKMLNGKC